MVLHYSLLSGKSVWDVEGRGRSCVTRLRGVVWCSRCCVLIAQLTLVMSDGSQALVLCLPPDPHPQLLAWCMNSVPVNSASSFYGSPRSLGLEEVGIQHRLWFVLQVPVSPCSAPFHIQLFFPLPALLTYDDFRPNIRYKSNCFP